MRQEIATIRPRKPLILRFRLSKREPVHWSLVELAPVCRAVVSFTRTGHAGLNTLTLGRKVHGHRLANGTYLIVASVQGRSILTRRFLVVRRRPEPRVAAAAIKETRCHSGVRSTENAAQSASAQTSSQTPPPTQLASPPAQLAALGGAPATLPHHGTAAGGAIAQGLPHALGELFGKPLSVVPSWMRPVLLSFSLLSIALLAAAALPSRVLPGTRLATLVAQRRLAIALSGLLVTLAVTLAAFLVG